MSKQVFTQVIRGAHQWVRQAEEALEKAIAEHGMTGPDTHVLRKPFDPSTLGRTVRELLNRRQRP